MKSTPLHNEVNLDVLALIPPDCRRVVDVGCMGGALAAAYRTNHASCDYIGIEMNPEYAELARTHCSSVLIGNIENLATTELQAWGPIDCWIFGDVLEHLYDPWGLITSIRAMSAQSSCIVACIPNAQHWSVQQRLCTGQLRYEPAGLLDRTHIRWFTRTTLLEMFATSGYKVEQIRTRIHPVPLPPRLEIAIRRMASAAGGNPDSCLQDAIPYQWVVRAIPIV